MKDKLVLAQSLKDLLAEKETAICQILCSENAETYCTTEFGNYIARRGDMLSFLPAGKLHEVNEDGSWRRSNRQDIKPAKLIQKLLRPGVADSFQLTSKHFEEFANTIKASQANDEDFGFAFRLVQGEDIRHYYYWANYSTKHSTGTMSDSCMRHGRCQSFLDIYVYNPDQVSLLVLLDQEERAVGRALIWKIDKSTTVMDRVYANDANTQVFHDYAHKNGWLHKTYQSAGSDYFTAPLKNTSNKLYFTLRVSLFRFDEYPYMDTFRFLDQESGLLTNKVQQSSKHWVSLCDTDGCTRTDDLLWSEYNNGFIYFDDAVHIRGSGFVWNHQAYQDYLGTWRLKPEMVVLIDGAEHPKEDSVELKGLGWIRSGDKAYYRYVKDRSRYYHLDNLILVPGTRSYIHLDDMVTLFDGSLCHRKNAVFIEEQGVFNRKPKPVRTTRLPSDHGIVPASAEGSSLDFSLSLTGRQQEDSHSIHRLPVIPEESRSSTSISMASAA